MTELIDNIGMSETEDDSPEILIDLYREDSEGMLPIDRSTLAWKYSRIYGEYGIEAIEELASLDPPERFVRKNKMWGGILAIERERRRSSGRRRHVS
jgi:hypothetical protein